jgi:poly(glycerol-phosphate) alpha-glucosyltransferase
MKIGYLLASMSRKSGGIFFSVRGLTSHLKSIGHDTNIFAGEDEYSLEDKAAWGSVAVNVFQISGSKLFGYQKGLRESLISSQLDIAHVCGLWMFPSVAVQSIWKKGVPYVISPHGMLDSWAIENSKWKKKLAAFVYEHKHLKNAACIHALCDAEYRAIRAFGIKKPVAVIPNGIELPQIQTGTALPNWFTALPQKCRVLLFLGRIHPKKGLESLLRAWREVKRHIPGVSQNWHLVIAGWEQGGHEKHLQTLTGDFGCLESVHFIGPQFNENKHGCFIHADAFILPSASEGLPMTVLEAWSYGLPVLMTPQCNLPEGFAVHAALPIAHEIHDFVLALTEIMGMSDQERVSMGKRGKKLVQEKFSWPVIATQMEEVYSWVLGRGKTPDCVVLS